MKSNYILFNYKTIPKIIILLLIFFTNMEPYNVVPIQEYHKNGLLKQEYYLIHKLKDGMEKTYYPNGNLESM